MHCTRTTCTIATMQTSEPYVIGTALGAVCVRVHACTCTCTCICTCWGLIGSLFTLYVWATLVILKNIIYFLIVVAVMFAIPFPLPVKPTKCILPLLGLLLVYPRIPISSVKNVQITRRNLTLLAGMQWAWQLSGRSCLIST